MKYISEEDYKKAGKQLFENGKLLVENKHFEVVDLDEDDMFEGDCDCCDGKGTVEEMDCNNQSNEGCGGCVKDVSCDNCDGSGFEMYEYENFNKNLKRG